MSIESARHINSEALAILNEPALGPTIFLPEGAQSSQEFHIIPTPVPVGQGEILPTATPEIQNSQTLIYPTYKPLGVDIDAVFAPQNGRISAESILNSGVSGTSLIMVDLETTAALARSNGYTEEELDLGVDVLSVPSGEKVLVPNVRKSNGQDKNSLLVPYDLNGKIGVFEYTDPDGDLKTSNISFLISPDGEKALPMEFYEDENGSRTPVSILRVGVDPETNEPKTEIVPVWEAIVDTNNINVRDEFGNKVGTLPRGEKVLKVGEGKRTFPNSDAPNAAFVEVMFRDGEFGYASEQLIVVKRISRSVETSDTYSEEDTALTGPEERIYLSPEQTAALNTSRVVDFGIFSGPVKADILTQAPQSAAGQAEIEFGLHVQLESVYKGKVTLSIGLVGSGFLGEAFGVDEIKINGTVIKVAYINYITSDQNDNYFLQKVYFANLDGSVVNFNSLDHPNDLVMLTEDGLHSYFSKFKPGEYHKVLTYLIEDADPNSPAIPNSQKWTAILASQGYTVSPVTRFA